MIEQWFGFGVLLLIFEMSVDPVLAVLVVARVAGIEGEINPHQAWYAYSYSDSVIV